MRTVAKPEVLDSGPDELCVDQEVALKADSRHRSTSRRYDVCTPTRQRRSHRLRPPRLTSSAKQRLINHQLEMNAGRAAHGLNKHCRASHGHIR